jgi:hypothetical protein
VPPAGVVGLAGQRQQPRALLLVVQPVQAEQVLDVALLETDPAEFHPADLRFGGADLPAGVLPADPLRLAQAAQMSTQQHAQRGGTAAGSVRLLLHLGHSPDLRLVDYRVSMP